MWVATRSVTTRSVARERTTHGLAGKGHIQHKDTAGVTASQIRFCDVTDWENGWNGRDSLAFGPFRPRLGG